MTLFDPFRYDGKRALVVGGATGMGAAIVDVLLAGGAEVVVMDRAQVPRTDVGFIELDLAERTSIDEAVATYGRPTDALFSCAGVADGTPGIERINFIGHRHLIDRLIGADLLVRGSAIGFISSAAGLGWRSNLDLLNEFLDVTDFDEAVKWVQDHGKADYWWSKQAVNAYVAREAFRLLGMGIRINAILPGPTDTPLARANEELWLGFGADYREAVGLDTATALEQAYPLVFLCSAAAGGITGGTLVTDAGYMAAGVTGSFPAATPIISMLLGE